MIFSLLFLYFIEVVLTWDSPLPDAPQPSGWRIYQDGAVVDTTTTRRWTSDITFLDVPVCWRVTAFNNIGESGLSNEVCLGKPQPPGALSVELPG